MGTAIYELDATQKHEKAYVAPSIRLLARNRRETMTVLMACTDAAAIVVSALAAAAIRFGLGYMLPSSIVARQSWSYAFFQSPEFDLAVPLVALFIAIYAWRGLYPGIAIASAEELQRLTVATSMVFLALGTVTFILRAPMNYSRLVYGMTWLFSLASVPVARSLLRKSVSRFAWWGEEIVVVRAGAPSLDIVSHLVAHPWVGLRPSLLVDLDHQASVRPSLLESLSRKSRGRINCALIVTDGTRQEIAGLLDLFRDIFFRVILVDGRPGHRLNWEASIDLGGIPGLEMHHNLLNARSQIIKRIMDIVLSTAGLVLAFPVLGALWVMVKLDSSGPGFYRQQRVGRDGRPFGMLKYRTMYEHANEKLESMLEADPSLRHEWEQYQKLHNDPRVTRVGRILRRYSLDELPQIWNVIRGEMSLVGPRPYLPEQQQAYGQGYASYVRVRPGLTGLWQVSGRADATFVDRATLDEHYVRTWSTWMDIYILARTPLAVFSRNGAY